MAVLISISKLYTYSLIIPNGRFAAVPIFGVLVGGEWETFCNVPFWLRDLRDGPPHPTLHLRSTCAEASVEASVDASVDASAGDYGVPVRLTL